MTPIPIIPCSHLLPPCCIEVPLRLWLSASRLFGPWHCAWGSELSATSATSAISAISARTVLFLVLATEAFDQDWDYENYEMW